MEDQKLNLLIRKYENLYPQFLNTSLIQGRSKIQPKLLITNQEVRKSLFSSDNVNQMFFQMFDHG